MTEQRKGPISILLPGILVGIMIAGGVYFSGASLVSSLLFLVVAFVTVGVIYLVRRHNIRQ